MKPKYNIGQEIVTIDDMSTNPAAKAVLIGKIDKITLIQDSPFRDEIEPYFLYGISGYATSVKEKELLAYDREESVPYYYKWLTKKKKEKDNE